MARSVLCYWTVKQLKMSGVQAARWFGVDQSSLKRSVVGGRDYSRVGPGAFALIDHSR